MELDRVATQLVLENVRQSLHVTGRSLVPELQALASERGEVDLATFLQTTGIEPQELWKPSVGGWTSLRHRAASQRLHPVLTMSG